MDDKNPDLIDDLLRRMEITKDSRFQANLRLKRRQSWSTHIVSLFSVFVIALSLLPNILELTKQQNQILLACSIFLSVYIIILSISEGSKNFYHVGELLHDSALKIDRLFNKLKIMKKYNDIDKGTMQAIIDEYEKCLEDANYNHEDVDYKKVVFKKPSLFPFDYTTSKMQRGYTKCMLFMRINWLEYSWTIIPLAMLMVTFLIIVIYVFGIDVQKMG